MAEVEGYGSQQVLESAQFITSKASHVQINMKAVEDTSEKLLPLLHPVSSHESPEGVPMLEPPSLSPNEVLEWTFLLDTLNFCFWSDDSTLFTVSYGGIKWTGYRSMCAALVKAVQDGIPIYKPSFYGSISKETMRSVFRSETDVSLPLIGWRRRNLIEAASVLKKEFDGKVSELIKCSQKSAQKLVSLLVEHFPSYRDVGTYRGRRVSYLKRAQIFAADVWHRFGGQDYGEFHDIDTLTMFADYRVPQCLLFLQVLEYSPELKEKLLAGEHLEPGGEMEAEIRGCSIWAVELIRQRICGLIQSLPPSSVDQEQKGVVNSVTLDFFLWNYAKSYSKDMEQYPIHRTHTIFY